MTTFAWTPGIVITIRRASAVERAEIQYLRDYVRSLRECLSFLIVLTASVAVAQDTPLISGGAGFISTTDGGRTFLQPVIAPVAAVPLGDRILIESRADLRGFYQRKNGNGPYEGDFTATLEYLQLDYTTASWLTLSAGRYLTPFGIYNERLSPIWVRNFQDVPLIFPMGTRTSGSSDGAMVRGVLHSERGWRLTYNGYFSASSSLEQFAAGRAAGGQASLFIPGSRVEIGASYQRFLQGRHLSTEGVHLVWQPWRLPVDARAEFAHSPSGYGYWAELAYRVLSKDNNTWLDRFQPLIRMQQFVRKEPVSGDSLPFVNTQRADFGLNYYLPYEVRLSASYARQFAATGDHNVWTVAATYRLLFPVGLGGAK